MPSGRSPGGVAAFATVDWASVDDDVAVIGAVFRPAYHHPAPAIKATPRRMQPPRSAGGSPGAGRSRILPLLTLAAHSGFLFESERQQPCGRGRRLRDLDQCRSTVTFRRSARECLQHLIEAEAADFLARRVLLERGDELPDESAAPARAGRCGRVSTCRNRWRRGPPSRTDRCARLKILGRRKRHERFLPDMRSLQRVVPGRRSSSCRNAVRPVSRRHSNRRTRGGGSALCRRACRSML